MSGTIFCILAFLSCLTLSVKNWRFGLCALISWGYFYGIIKAHYISSNGYFVFDAATVGFYAGFLLKWPNSAERKRWQKILPWVTVLIAWPLFMAIVPMQHYLVQIVGLRGNIFWIPMLLIGALLDKTGIYLISLTLAICNLIAVGFAAGEYFLGVEQFLPENEVTQIVYNSNDIAGGHKRIPSIFTNAHTYAGAMIASIPWILGNFLEGASFRSVSKSLNFFFLSGLFAALIGIFVAGPRSPVVALALLISIFIMTGRVSFAFLSVLVLSGIGLGYFVASNERLQRFTELQDLNSVQNRIASSLDVNLLDVLVDYPMGNGMGAGGTSLPYFVQPLLNKSFTMENEYARILLEQGIIGLVLILSFAIRVFVSPPSFGVNDRYTKYLCWSFVITSFSTAWIGIGLMSSIPTTALLLLGAGYWFSPGSGPVGFIYKTYPNAENIYPYSSNSAYQRGLSRA